MMRVEYFELSGGFSGLSEIWPGENAGACGLSPGDVLMAVDSGAALEVGCTVAAGFRPLATLVAGSCPSFKTAGFRFCQC